MCALISKQNAKALSGLTLSFFLHLDPAERSHIQATLIITGKAKCPFIFKYKSSIPFQTIKLFKQVNYLMGTRYHLLLLILQFVFYMLLFLLSFWGQTWCDTGWHVISSSSNLWAYMANILQKMLFFSVSSIVFSCLHNPVRNFFLTKGIKSRWMKNHKSLYSQKVLIWLLTNYMLRRQFK